MDKKFWSERWQLGQTRFHEGSPNRHLVGHAVRLGLQQGDRVLVPLSGKSEDLAWLATQGYAVTGVEFIEDAARAFFAEHGLSPEERSDGPFKLLTSGRIEILVGDFFALPGASQRQFDAVYDRAALIAIEPERRREYVSQLFAALPVRKRYLLVTFVYDTARMSGPPFSVDEAAVTALLSPFGKATRLADEELIEREPRFRERGLDSVREQVWLFDSTAS